MYVLNISSLSLDLHSHPTRRSSDLTRSFPGSDRPPASAHIRRIELSELTQQEIRTPAPDQTPPVQDRKSTRLNSSHTVISYAVFCLKKKKIMNGKRKWKMISISLLR